ncbi:unnamed protein product [Ilex paraguariensis]|uniref:Bifunctional inhibitor/plant lipid transfer protein/seed storage helical domain-containing protein n=1 Tax=Ilex paraguariensis TaxID=185542 RepID=A0ABC8S340_9AQUA
MGLKVSCFALCLVAVVVVVLVMGEARVAVAVTCTPTELSPCAEAIKSPKPPSAECCKKLKEQIPCLCGYIKDPNLKQYVNSPNAQKVAKSCGVKVPTC